MADSERGLWADFPPVSYEAWRVPFVVLRSRKRLPSCSSSISSSCSFGPSAGREPAGADPCGRRCLVGHQLLGGLDGAHGRRIGRTEELAQHQVPPTDVLLANGRNSMDSVAWAIHLNRALFDGATPTEEQPTAEAAPEDWRAALQDFDPHHGRVPDPSGVADTVYHEARHAEQYFRAARIALSRGMALDKVVTGLPIAQRIAEAAVGREQSSPVDPESAGGREAEAWLDSHVGSGRGNRGKVVPLLDTASGPRWNTAFEDYRALPEERDAWAVGESVGARYHRLGEEERRTTREELSEDATDDRPTTSD